MSTIAIEISQASTAAAPAGRRRKPTARATARRVPSPVITRLTTSVELMPPAGYAATVVLKEVARDERVRYYKWWLMVGRDGDDAAKVTYRHKGDTMLRCDIPQGMAISEDALIPGLKAFWARQPSEPDDVKPKRASAKRRSAFGCMKGRIEILGDIVSPIDVKWNAEQ